MLAFPLVAWGTPDDTTAAPYVNQAFTPTPTAGQADPFGGTAAVLWDDNDAVQIERRGFNYVNKTTGEVTFFEFVKQGTSTGCCWIIRDTTAGGIDLVSCTLTWSTLTLAKATGNGRMVGVVPVGGGWYVVIFTATGCVSGHTHQYMFGPTLLTGTLQGSTYWYRRNAVLLDIPDDERAWRSPREGSERIRSDSGLVDRWITGFDYRFTTRARWIPTQARSAPVVVSGFEGLNEFTGIDVGVQTMLTAGQGGSDLLWVPDRSICTDYITSELVRPWQDDYGFDATFGDRTLELELRNTLRAYPTAA